MQTPRFPHLLNDIQYRSKRQLWREHEIDSKRLAILLPVENEGVLRVVMVAVVKIAFAVNSVCVYFALHYPYLRIALFFHRVRSLFFNATVW